MLQNYLNKSGELNAISQRKLNCFNGLTHVRKLSDFNQSQSSNIASVMFDNLFIIVKDREEIIAYGFSPLCKSVIRPNENNPYTVKFFEDKRERERLARKFEEFERAEFELQCALCRKSINADPRFSEFVERRRLAGDKDRTIAWKLKSATRVPNLSDFSIREILSCL